MAKKPVTPKKEDVSLEGISQAVDALFTPEEIKSGVRKVGMQNLTEEQQKKVREIQAEGGKAEVVKCIYCGKILIRDASIEQESGDLCHQLRQRYSEEDLRNQRQALSGTEVPEGWIKVAALHKICVREGIPVARMVKAIGGDRGLGEYLDPRFKPLYVGNCRWLDPWCASKEALDLLRGGRQTKDEKARAEVQKLEAEAQKG